LIERIASERPLELHAIDTWQGGIEHSPGGASEIDMRRVERTFLKNTGKCVDKAPHTVDFHVHKCSSHQALSRLIAEGREQQFDLIYIDGSHQAPDVLADAILSFKLLRVGGIMIFDDYLWEEPLPGGTDPLRNPKLAIDAFVNVYIRKLNVLSAPLEQLYVRKVSE
jgi:predicted O-methyltransferase YrrM